MDSRVALALVGLSHRTAPVEVRERFVVRPADLQACLTALRQIEGVGEACVLSTCNRTEALVVGTRGADVASAVRAQLFRNADDGCVYVYEDLQALIHCFRVAAGLDSMVLGESEILGQLKQAFESALELGALGPFLKPLLRQALHVGKRVRSETAIGQGSLSVARVAVDVAARAFDGFADVRALVVGAGETGVLAARHLCDLGLRRLEIANRTLDRAETAAAALGAVAWPLSELRARLCEADLVLVCVEGGDPIGPGHFDRRGLRRRDRPLLVIDLSVPRAVEDGVHELPNLLAYDIDDLSRVVERRRGARAEAIEGTAEILVSELHRFLAGRVYAAFTPAISSMRQRFEVIRDDVVDQVAGGQSSAGEVQIAHELTKRLLDAALNHMKEGAWHTRSDEELDREYRRFLERLR